VTAETALGIRFAVGAAMLLAFQLARRGALAPARRERVACFLLGAIGYAAESSFFYAALGRGSAAAVGLLFYAYPAIVTLLELATGALRASGRLFLAIALSAGGVAVVVATGASLTISALGAVFSLSAALSFSLYFLTSHRIVKRTDPVVNAAWVSLGAGASLLLRGLLLGRLHSPAGHELTLLGYGLANAVAFGLMFVGLRRLGPTRTALLLTIEVAGTVVLSAIFLDETLRAIQLVGGAAIAVGALLVSTSAPAPAEH
jgi:drug/metabolite transporter (DMT)-like permease